MSGYIRAGGAGGPAGPAVVAGGVVGGSPPGGAPVEFTPGGVVTDSADPVVPAAAVGAVVALAPGVVVFVEDVVGVVPVGAGVDPAGVDPAGVDPAGVDPAGVDPAGAGVVLPPAEVVGMGIELRTSSFLVST